MVGQEKGLVGNVPTTFHVKKCSAFKDIKNLNNLLVLQIFTTIERSGNILFTYRKFFSSDSHQSKKTSDIFRLTFFRSLSDVFML